MVAKSKLKSITCHIWIFRLDAVEISREINEAVAEIERLKGLMVDRAQETQRLRERVMRQGRERQQWNYVQLIDLWNSDMMLNHNWCQIQTW